jgi:hypothetical protein
MTKSAHRSQLLKNHSILGTVPVFHYSPAIVVYEFSIWFRPHPRAAGRRTAATAAATATATATSVTISCPSHRTWWCTWTLWRHLRRSCPAVCRVAVSWGWMRSTLRPTWRPGSPSSSWPRTGRSSYSTWR